MNEWLLILPNYTYAGWYSNHPYHLFKILDERIGYYYVDAKNEIDVNAYIHKENANYTII